MKKTFLLSAAIMAATATTAMAAESRSGTAHDNFDRAVLGNRWAIRSGRLFINNNQMRGDAGSLGYDKKSSTNTTVAATLYLNGTDLEYGAVASGDIASGNNAFVKLQEQNGSGEFEYGAFYVGNGD